MVGITVSVALHVAVMLWLPRARDVSVAGAIAPNAERDQPPLPTTVLGTAITLEVVSPPPLVGAPRSQGAVDSGGNRAGGDRRSEERTWLLDQSHALTLDDSARNTDHAAQTQRIDTAVDRASEENRRATLHPDDQTFLASGSGWVRQRADVGPRESAAGRDTAVATLHALGSGPNQAEGTRKVTSVAAGTSTPQPDASRGRARTHGELQTQAVPIVHARPDVDRGAPATLANTTGRTRDNRDADLRAAQLMQSFVQAGAAGDVRAVGRGGQDLGDQPGAGERSTPGSRAHAFGDGGEGEPGGERYIRWYAEQRKRIARALVFPRDRQLSLDQGTTLLRLWIGRNGGLLEPPAVMRSSGFGDLDQAALTAVLRSVPFSPLPDDIAPDSERIRLTVPIEFWNPTVH